MDCKKPVSSFAAINDIQNASRNARKEMPARRHGRWITWPFSTSSMMKSEHFSSYVSHFLRMSSRLILKQVDFPPKLCATTTFSQASTVTPTGSATLTDFTTQAAAGDFTLTIQGQGDGKTHTTTVNPQIYDFTMSLSPSDSTVLRGGSTAYFAILTLVTGSSTPPSEALVVTGLPADATTTLIVTSLTPTISGDGVSITVQTTSASGGSLGYYSFVLTATSTTNLGGGSRSGGTAYTGTTTSTWTFHT